MPALRVQIPQVEKLDQRASAQFEFAATLAGEDEAYIKKFHEEAADEESEARIRTPVNNFE